MEAKLKQCLVWKVHQHSELLTLLQQDGRQK